jgi:hypothetical protein
MSDIQLVKIAADPEMFVTNSRTGEVSSVAGLLGCSKEEKMHFADFRLQEDNVLVEFDIDPQTTSTEFSGNIERAIMQCAKTVQDKGFFLTDIASHEYTKKELMSFDKSAFVFGCNPDTNIRNGIQNRMPKAKQGLRTAGGHIHLGWEHLNMYKNILPLREQQHRVGAMCDYFLGLESLSLDHDERRRELYGKAGAARLKSYGLEYRSLSNFWIFKPELRDWAFKKSKELFEVAMNESRYYAALSIAPHEQVQAIIDTGDKQAASVIISKLGGI